MIGFALTKTASEARKPVKPPKPDEKKKKRKKEEPKKEAPKDDMNATDMRKRRRLLFRREVEVISDPEDMPMPSEEQGNAFLVGIAGRRKSGKTFFLDKLVKTIWKGEFNKIYVLSQTAEKQKQYFGTWKGDIKYIKEWDQSFFDQVTEELEKEEEHKFLIIIDDMSSDMREKLYASQIDKFSFIGRHFRCSVCWLGQKITLFTPGFRQEADAFILFREENMQELRLLHREWGFGDMDDFICTLLENTLEKYSWLMLRNIGGTVHIMRPPNEEEQTNFVSHK